MFYDILSGRLTTIDREITARCIAIMNRADPDGEYFYEKHLLISHMPFSHFPHSASH
jgi:hypothetical protein